MKLYKLTVHDLRVPFLGFFFPQVSADFTAADDADAQGKVARIMGYAKRMPFASWGKIEFRAWGGTAQ